MSGSNVKSGWLASMEITVFLITKEDIQHWCGSNTIYRRGVSYFREDRVVDLSFAPERNTWYGIVQGNDLYDVEVEIDEDAITGTCDCPAFEKYMSCKHVVAVLLEIHDFQHEDMDISGAKHESAVETPGKYRLADQVIQSFVNLADDSEESGDVHSKRPLQVAFICKTYSPAGINYSNQQYLAIECKVGVDRPYVVKDLQRFLRCVMQRTTYFFTKKYTYDPSEQYFLDEDWNIIQLLQEIQENESFGRIASPWSYSAGGNSRFLIIPPMVADELLEKLRHRNVTLDMESSTYQAFDIQDGPLPFTFELDRNGPEEFLLDLSAIKHGTYFDSYGYFFLDGTFYKLSSEQKVILQDLFHLRHPANEASLPVNREQMEMIVSHVMPGLKKIGQVEISDQVSDQITNPPLQAKIFLDREGDRLSVTIEYHYDDIVIAPFQTEHASDPGEETILMRDAELERELMTIFERAPMHYNGTECFIEGEEDLYDFLFTTVPQLEEKADIYMTQAVRSLFLTEKQKPTTSIDIDSSGNLLEIGFDMEGIDPENVQNILEHIVEKKKYYRLPDGAFVPLEEDAFQKVDRLLTELNVPKTNVDSTIRVPVHRSLQIDDIMGSGRNDSVKTGKKFRRLIQDLKNPDTLDFSLPDGLRATLRDYQQIGFQWLKSLAHYRLGGILADDMGLGKTLQSIAYLLSEKEQTEDGGRSLIVAPASVIYNWKNEFDKFSSGLKVGVAYGTPKERSEVVRDNRYDVLITSYPLLRQDVDLYKEQTFDSMILDEAQAIKNHATKTAKAVKQMNAGKRFALSGTPIENSLDELWSIFDAVLPGFFGDHKSYKKLSQERITQMARPFILRRLKGDVLKELPDKIETVHETELTKQQKELYLGYLERIQQETKQSIDKEGFQKSRMKILAGLTRLRQLCCHPSLFLENYEGRSGKLEQLMDMVRNALENGQRLLIFSQFASMLQMIRERLAAENISCFYLDGATPSRERISMAERFNNGDKDAFLVSLKAGGTGLNLTGADTVILYDLWWNPAVEEQATGRAHRIGQKNVVQVMRVIARGTIEEKIYEMQQKKKALIEQVVQPGETMLTSLSEEEIRDILEI